ncbi:MAG: molybdopterin molybdotransferase MoeA [Actinomycetota bacterium]|jgi:molybdenum cofactor synthesis domain-containing protein|nr:molybdopterin molybdotransferase MoeA [Actinomycetota bacterium]
MIPLEEARTYVLDRCSRKEPIFVAINDALGLVTAVDVIAEESIPPFANTAMDGFAVRSSDVGVVPVQLRIIETIAAGYAPKLVVGSGEASRIMTGAPIPEGADAVVMVEKTSVKGDAVTIEAVVQAGNHIRPAGDDVTSGQLVFARGTVLTAGHLGVLCSLGMNEIEAYPRLRVGVMSTGDELVDDGGPLAPGQIRDSNRRTLISLLNGDGFVAVDLGLIPDDEAAIESALLHGAGRCDALVTSGGVSMGDFDYVKAVLDRVGDMRWMQIAIKPAKPLAFGTIGSTPVFGLPGNPVSSMVSYELFARSGLRTMMGFPEPIRTAIQGIAVEPLVRHPDGKTHYSRVLARYEDGGIRVRSVTGQGSHMLTSMARSNALAILPNGDGCDEGDVVDILLLN